MARFRYFPVSYDVAGRIVVVVGDGEPALLKLRLLVRTEARLMLYAKTPMPALTEFAAAHGVTLVAGPPTTEALGGAALVFVATGDDQEDTRLGTLARQCGVPVNVVDRPHLCDFATPAIVDRAPLSVAVATDGHAPVLAQMVRAKIEALLPPAFGRLATLAGAVRETVLLRLPDNAARRRFWSALLSGRAAALALAGEEERARVFALATLADAQRSIAPSGKVFLVGAGPGAPDLLTVRAHRLLAEADVIVHDALVPDTVVAMGRRDAMRIAVGGHEEPASVAESDVAALLVRLAREGRRVVRLEVGDPIVSGDARQVIATLRAAGVDHEIVPGLAARRDTVTDHGRTGDVAPAAA
ncbi:siroheme synthase [Rhodoplanes azumiensis]|uniref:precorrin-2 dehydrogenase n=1 Tax=Rhodoplanes azumiensis TaxID=1897628 RepID=A0ABW5ALG8_9BRAD